MEQRQRSETEELHALRQIRVRNGLVFIIYVAKAPLNPHFSLCVSDSAGRVRACASHV